MHPNTFLRTFWRGEIKPQVFVAMSFDSAYNQRFADAIRPAIETDINYNGAKLKAHRVDLSQTGDSILTEIADGVANSVMVLADVSTVGKDAVTGVAYRNANVMYEVGMALACRQPAEVLLIRDDEDKFLFDVSTVPHEKLNFTEASTARATLAKALQSRLREIDLVYDARIKIAISSLTGPERQILAQFSVYGMDSQFWRTKDSLVSAMAISRLLDKQLIRTAAITHDNHAMYVWTPLGKAVADNIDHLVPMRDFSAPPQGAAS